MKTNQYLYIIRCGVSKHYKIGISENPEFRLDALQVGCPYPLILIYKKYFKKALKVEKYLHRTYWDKRKTKEWFKFSNDEINCVQQGLDFYITNPLEIK